MCLKNNFYEIDISPNFRIGDTSEIEILCDLFKCKIQDIIEYKKII